MPERKLTCQIGLFLAYVTYISRQAVDKNPIMLLRGVSAHEGSAFSEQYVRKVFRAFCIPLNTRQHEALGDVTNEHRQQNLRFPMESKIKRLKKISLFHQLNDTGSTTGSD